MVRSKTEQDLQNEGRLCIGSLPFVRLYRNNVGTLYDRNGTPVSYGLAIGSADTIGIVAPYGRLLSIEWKRPGWKPPSHMATEKESVALKRHIDQCNWRDQINAQGGIAGFASTLADGLLLVALAKGGYAHNEIFTEEQGSEIMNWVFSQEAAFRERMAARDQRKSNSSRR